MVPMAKGLIGPEHVLGELHDVVTGRVQTQQSPQDVTIFKSVGVALEDLVAAELVVG